MEQTISYADHLSSANDLVTSREQTRAGFIAMALEKNYLAVPYIEEAKALKNLARRVQRPSELLTLTDIRPGLLTASGLSDKAMNYLTEEDLTEAIEGLIENFLEPAGDDFINELVYRYLLIKGDALGGKSRNLAGTLGERKFLRALLSLFNVTGLNYYWMDSDNSYSWHTKPNDDTDLEKRIKGLAWQKDGKNRVLVLNINVPNVGKNVDLCLLNGTIDQVTVKGAGSKQSIHRDHRHYISLGELKGGIDPAGADEHWKTANSALNRIRRGFEQKQMNPSTFFVGAAIENSMAQEIYRQLTDGRLNNAANLTEDSQLTSLCHWLIHQ